MTTVDHRRFLAAAIRVGARQNGQTWPNPSVGCLLVRKGCVVGIGTTQPGGRPHAEVVALSKAGNQARGATAYVSLEPCNHYGRTGPCTLALIEAGVKQVVIALGDPDSRVCGSGVQRLRDAAIDVLFEPFADLKEKALQTHHGHITRMQLGRPHVTLKLALGLDGGIGRAGAGQVAITGPQTNRLMHAVRAHMDAIAVGANTVAADDPQLTVRLPGLEHRSPVAVVFGGIEPTSNALASKRPQDRIVFFESERAHNVPAALADLGGKGITSLLVEGGAKLAQSFLQADCVDDIVLLQGATKVGAGAIKPFKHDPFDDLSAAGLANFERVEHRQIGDDIIMKLTRKNTA